MRILICDAEHMISEQVTQYLQEYFLSKKYEMPELVTFSDGNALLADTGRKDIVFLDTELPGFDGIEAGRELKKAAPNVLLFIISSDMQYLDDAMRMNAYRYLSKPLDKNRLFENMEDAMKSYYLLNSAITIENKGVVTTIPEADIIFIEAQLRTTVVHTVSGRYSAEKTIHSWTKTLHSGSFFQTHKSYIVNMKYVLQFDQGTITFYAGRENAYLSRRKFNQFKEAYFAYMENAPE